MALETGHLLFGGRALLRASTRRPQSHLLMSVAQLLLRRSGALRQLLIQAGAALRQSLLGLGAACLQLSVERVGPVLCQILSSATTIP